MKKITTIATIALLAIMGTSGAYADNLDGAKLFENKCAACHKMGTPNEEGKLAPHLVGVVTHLNEAFKTKDEIKKHIEDFVVNPSEDKAICRSVRRYGVMPSQKGAVTKEELSKIAEWMSEQKGMTPQEHDQMQKKHHRGNGQGKGMYRGKGSQNMGRGQGRGHGKGLHRGQGKGQGQGMHRGRGKGSQNMGRRQGRCQGQGMGRQGNQN